MELSQSTRPTATSRSVVSGPRALRHVGFAAASGVLMAAVYAWLGFPAVTFGLSMASAYVGLLALAVVLIIGPLNLLRSRPNPVSTDLRRDLGIWAGFLGLLHVATGIQVHFPGRFWLYFLNPPGQPHRLPIRTDLFGFANLTGLGATVIVLLLLVLSNDASLRALGASRWKAWQRWNYGYAALVIVHTVAYQLNVARTVAFVVASALMILGMAVMQLLGVLTTVRRSTTDRTGAHQP